MFGMGTKEKESSDTDEKSNPWGSSIAGAASDARKAGAGSKARAKASSDEASSRSSIPDATREQITKLFKPEAWKPIVKAPFALGQALTGRKCWEPTESEIDTLSVQTSMSMEYVGIVNPMMLALGMCATSWCMILADKFIQNARERNKELADNPLQEPVKAQGATVTPINLVHK